MRLQPSVQAKRSRAAFTLVEASVGTLLVGLVAIALYAGFSSGFAAVQTARENLRATQILVQRMETVRLLTWSQILDTNRYLKPIYIDYYDPTGLSSNSAGERYTATVRAILPTNLPAAYRTNVRDITITLYWTNRNGKQAVTHSREMTTRVARIGMQQYIYGQ
jgi:type II secretory pathway pseudopilin PulG